MYDRVWPVKSKAVSKLGNQYVPGRYEVVPVHPFMDTVRSGRYIYSVVRRRNISTQML
jgi:hypothetical protein